MITGWFEHVEKWKDCQRCPLGEQRNRICIARGSIPADVCFIGEAPGPSEDAIGFPFKGPAGHKMDWIIDNSIPTGVSHVLTNLVLCFPREAKARGDNEPERGEILECRPRLIEFINIAQPRLIVAVGSLANQYIPNNSDVQRIHIYHPAYILARLKKVQQSFEFHNCVVQVRCAVRAMLQCDKKPWKEWRNDQDKLTRQQLRQMYNYDDEIPY